jgi:hypothetical protein
MLPLLPTAFCDIADAVQTALRALPAICPAEQVLQDIEAGEMPDDVQRRIVISMGGGRGDYSFASGQAREWQTALRIDCLVRRDDVAATTATGTTLRPARGLLGLALERLEEEFIANQWNGTVMQIQSITVDDDHELADTRLGAAWAVLQVTHRTSGNLIAQA